MKLEIEKPIHFRPSLVAVISALFIGGMVLVSNNWCAGLITFYVVFSIVQATMDLLSKLALPMDAQLCAQAALKHFQDKLPDAQILSVAVRDMDEERFIISVRHETPHTLSRSTAHRYYAVKRSDKSVSSEDTSIWRPRGLK